MDEKICLTCPANCSAAVSYGSIYCVMQRMHLPKKKAPTGCEGCIAISRCVVETWRCHACTRNPDLRDRYESEALND